MSGARRAALLGAALLAVAAVVVAIVVATRTDSGGGEPAATAASTATSASTTGTSASADAPAAKAPTALRSRADLRPPAIDVRTRAHDTRPGLMLVAPKKVFGAKEVQGEQQGPMLVDDAGRVRWFQPLPEGDEAYDLRVQRYEGRPVLTWWQGRAVRGSGKGVGMIYDTRMQPIARVEPAGGAIADIHEFKLTDRGTALMLVYRSGIDRDLSAIGGEKDAKVVDGIVQEIDVRTGRLLFEWHALDHIDPAESHEPLDKLYIDSWDYVHFNSVDVDTDGNLLVSARHTWAVYKINREDGSIMWRLGGKRSDFRMDPDLRFSWQHDARADGPDRIRVFDNAAASEPVRPQSRVLTLQLDEQSHRATLVASIEHPDKLSAGTQGNAQALGGGHTFVGWGSQGHFSEFGPGGDLLFDARVPHGYDTYRAYRARWHSSPVGQPAIAVRAADGHATAYASWNGATEVAAWRVLTGPEPDRLRPAGDRVAWTGLETRLPVDRPGHYVAVEALDRGGDALGRSPATEVSTG